MPRTKLGRDAYRADDLQRLIRRYQGRDNTDAVCAAMAKVSPATYARRMRAKTKDTPCGAGELSVNELIGLQHGLQIPPAEICRVLFE